MAKKLTWWCEWRGGRGKGDNEGIKKLKEERWEMIKGK
jgi:hypothetical protein